MSCITVVGRRRYWEEGCDEHLSFSSPPWTTSKMKRLTEQAQSTDPKLRAIAANNPRTPHYLLARLARDPDLNVRRWVAKNPALPEEILVELTYDEDPGVALYALTVLTV